MAVAGTTPLPIGGAVTMPGCVATTPRGATPMTGDAVARNGAVAGTAAGRFFMTDCNGRGCACAASAAGSLADAGASAIAASAGFAAEVPELLGGVTALPAGAEVIAASHRGA